MRMLEKKLTPGRYIDFRPGDQEKHFKSALNISIPEGLNHLNERFVPIEPRFYHIEKPNRRDQNWLEKTSRILPGTAPNRTGIIPSVNPSKRDQGHRNFIWLPFRPGLITEVQSDGVDVLSGPFSGCLMVTYRKNGKQYVAHLGTGEKGSPETLNVKAAWQQFVGSDEVEVDGWKYASVLRIDHGSGNVPHHLYLCGGIHERKRDYLVRPATGVGQHSRVWT
jgi:hypothetical protein